MTEDTTGPEIGSELTLAAFRRSLTGFEEIGVAKMWGSPWLALHRENYPEFVRAMVSVDLKRKGAADARNAALQLTSGQCEDYFADDPEPAGEKCQQCGQVVPPAEAKDGEDQPGEAS